MDTQERKQPTSVTILVSVTFLGEGQEPLVAIKTKVDGQEVKLPLAVFMGEGQEPLFVRANIYSPTVSAVYARAFQEAAAREALGIIEVAGRAIMQLQQPQPQAQEPQENSA